MSNQAFIIVPVPTQGDSHDVNTTSQDISSDTKQQIARLAHSAINGNKNGPQDSFSSTQYGQSSSPEDPLSHKVDSAQDSELKNKESGEKENVQESATVKTIIDNPRGLLSLINWENPRLTLSSLTTVVTLLLASRYFHLMQWVFKALSVTLGAVTVVEFVTRSTLGKSVIERVKPQTYFTVSDSTLNRIFAEVREATQHILVQAQKLIYGEDLSSTFIAFAVSFSLYWLIKLFTLWQLAVLVVPFVYIVPLLLSARSKQQVYNAAGTAAQKASATAAEVKDNAAGAAQNASAAAAEVKDNAAGAAQKAYATAAEVKDNAAGAAQKASATAAEVKNNAADTAARKASDTTAEVKDKAQDVDLQQTRKDAADTVSSTVSNTESKSEGTARNATNKVSFAEDYSPNSHPISNDSAEGFQAALVPQPTV